MKIELENAVVYQGSNLDVLPTLPDNSVDSIVTDPPYELGFMGKSWDNSGIAYSVELWTECMRVLKPGGHLLAFGGSRTWHRLAVAIEDAGFEIRDSIAWLYGSGFPKSMDISKQIDKNNGRQFEDRYALGRYIRASREALGFSRDEVNSWFGYKAGVQHWEAQDTNNAQPPTQSDYLVLKEKLNLSNEFDDLVARIEAEREVIGIQKNAMAGWSMDGTTKFADRDITIPATDEAKQWRGWGTALKPAFEPVVVARKPLEEKTVAANVLKYGTGGLNIDGSRIGTETLGGGTMPDLRDVGQMSKEATGIDKLSFGQNPRPANRIEQATYTGRWPANIILDPYTAELLDEQSGITKSGDIKPHKSNNTSAIYGGGDGFQPDITGSHKGDTGGASRFFYVAKASKKDRNEGLDELPQVASKRYGDRDAGSLPKQTPQGEVISKNFHPTVKPTTLMEYLIKLVTPPNGIVLDPFTGSGSTGKAALLNGFNFIGIELTEEYLPIIEGRLKWASEQVSKETSEVLF